eukprot:scaffold358_cov207-Alexandrium_tamarense.AAC.16
MFRTAALSTFVSIALPASNHITAEVESLASDATTSLKGASISEESLKEATDVQNKSIDLGSLLQKAVEASKEADEIEALAEEALAVAEAGLEQHLKDFPEAD